jgi:hypothetical protein
LQSQEDEHRECQENDGVDIEHVSHAFGYRSSTIDQISVSSRRRRDNRAAGFAAIASAGGHANP